MSKLFQNNKLQKYKKLFTFLIIILVLLTVFAALIAEKRGVFLTRRSLYYELKITEREKQSLDLNMPVKDFVQTEERLVGESEKCNLQIEFPKKIENSNRDLNLNLKDYLSEIIIDSGGDLVKEKILQAGEILQIDAPSRSSFSNQDFSIACSDTKTMPELFEMQEKSEIKDRKDDLEKIYSLGRIMNYWFGGSEYRARINATLKLKDRYVFYNLDQKQLSELTGWEISKSKLKSIKMIERINFIPGASVQMRTFNLFFEHQEKGYWIKFAVNRNLSLEEAEKAFAEYAEERAMNFGIVDKLQKEEATGIFADQVNLKFKNN